MQALRGRVEEKGSRPPHLIRACNAAKSGYLPLHTLLQYNVNFTAGFLSKSRNDYSGYLVYVANIHFLSSSVRCAVSMLADCGKSGGGGMTPPAPAPSSDISPLCRRLLLTQTVLYGILILSGLVYLCLALVAPPSFWLPVARLVLAASLLALSLIDNALRSEGYRPRDENEPADAAAAKPVSRSRLPHGLWTRLQYVHQHLATTLITAAVALALAVANLTDAQVAKVEHAMPLPLVGFFVLVCFVLLIVERTLSFKPVRGWRYQQHHIGLARVALSLFLLLTGALLAAAVAPLLARWSITLASLIVLLVALEYLLRAAMALAVSPAARTHPRFLTRSLLADMYQWPLRPVARALSLFQQRFGIDLSQIQAFRVMGRRLLPVTCGIAAAGWLLSGLSEIQLHQRGIYERFGRPVAVLPPGLHAGLPWPFGRVITVENGIVHELQLSDSVAQTSVAQPDSAEGPAPQSSWRLWDSSHATDQSQVIASAAGDSQNFQMVNTDIRLIWRVGLRDRDALNSTYHAQALPVLIRSIARQILMTQFASKQLDALLDEQRATLATSLTRQIQQRLDQLNTGAELLFTRIEAIHPPAGAADAYHGVQAAQIAAGALIAREKGYAAAVTRKAQQNASTGILSAQAFAAEDLSRARAAAANFAAEQQAWHMAGSAFITERRYQILSRALSRTPLLILDNHLQGENEPVLDLRQLPMSADSTAPQKASTK